MNVAIITCDARRDVLEGILPTYPAGAKIYSSKEPEGPAWNLERVFRDHMDEDGVLVLQDDLIIPKWFQAEVEKAIIPGEVMTFHSHTGKAKRYYLRGFSYARMWQVWGQANYYPRWFIEAYFEWTNHVPPLKPGYVRNIKNSERSPEEFCYREHAIDDGCITACLLWIRKKALLTLPELVQHNVQIPSNRRDEIPPDWISHIFGKRFLRPWDTDRVFDAPPLWVLRPFIHPERMSEFPPNIIDRRIRRQPTT